MDRPEMTCEIAVSWEHESVRIIHFNATPDAAADMEQFGDVAPGGTKNSYRIIVDARYRFGDVLAYIAQYGQVEAV